jgi:5-dehydro-4-deoxyglucarate dehydratase
MHRKRNGSQAQGVLLLPHYLTEASQEGLAAHIETVCRSVSLGVIVYNRGLCRLNIAVLEQLADRCHNLVGFKDGIGDIELMVTIRRRLGERLAYVCGMRRGGTLCDALQGIGCAGHSSAVFKLHSENRDDASTTPWRAMITPPWAG